jgi:predicted RNA methylase
MLFDELADVLLDATVSPGDLRAAGGAMAEALHRMAGVELDSDTTMLQSGKALSPRAAALCLKDPLRTAVFLRGVNEALRQREDAEVVYAGTGPFAPLVLPLMARYPRARFTLIDIHAQSVESVRRVTAHFGLSNSRIVLADATTYQHGRPIDVVIVETMQVALAKEPQLAIAHNLIPQLAPAGVLIPRRISVDAVLVDLAAETGRAMGEPLPSGTRIPLGTVIELSRETTRLESTIKVPEHHHVLAFFTRVEVFGDHVLDEYDSSLTYPRLEAGSTPRAGRSVSFRYRPGPEPRIVVSAAAADWLRDRLPGLRLDGDVIARRVGQAIARARAAGHRQPAALRLYVLLSFALGPHFDERVRVREQLQQAGGSVDERLLKMPEWSHPNCWLGDDSDQWDDDAPQADDDLDWPVGEPLPPQLQPGYGFRLDVPQYTTPLPVVTAMLELAEMKPEDVLLDLGSGDGRVAIEAARRFGVRAAGVDIDPEQVRKGSEAARAAGVADRVSFRRGDLLDADVSSASVVTLYLLPEMNLRLRDRLRRQLRPGSRIISRSFDMGDWAPEAITHTDLGPIYRWRVE